MASLISYVTSMVSYVNSFTHQTSSHTTVATSQSSLWSEEEEFDPLQRVIEEMNRRATTPFGFGVGIGRAIGTHSDQASDDPLSIEKILKNVKREGVKKRAPSVTAPFSKYYSQLFPQHTLRVLYLELDPGVDDGAALLQLLAVWKSPSTDGKKKIEIVGIVPCVGNAILSQTEKNTLQFLELTESQDIKVYPGAIAPLAIENNQTAIKEMNKQINATHFYGYDGEEDVGGWPKITMDLQKIPGYKFAATMISNSSSEAPLTLVSTSALTELSKTLIELERLDEIKDLPPGSFAKNINAISIMGGCINPKVGCNAPFNVPDYQKISEANFYFDSPAAQIVFTMCQKYGIPILLAPLDLTQQADLLWTKKQVNQLRQINNPTSNQMAKVTNVIPYIDALHFPNGTYPMHDLQAVTSFLYPDFYNATKVAAQIGDIGQITIDPHAKEEQKNVYVLQMPVEKQSEFYSTVLPEYHNFD